MASRASVPAAGPVAGPGRVTRYVCTRCSDSQTGQLSSRGLFLSWAASQPCFTAKLGFRDIQVDVRTSDIMAGAGGPAAAPDVRHQPEGTARRECPTVYVYPARTIYITNVFTLVA